MTGNVCAVVIEGGRVCNIDRNDLERFKKSKETHGQFRDMNELYTFLKTGARVPLPPVSTASVHRMSA